MASRKNRYWKYYQPNKNLLPYVREVQAVPNASQVYSKYLEDNGFKWIGLKVKKGCKRPTVQSFAKEHLVGRYFLIPAHHFVAVSD